jgi:hypothetical protein
MTAIHDTCGMAVPFLFEDASDHATTVYRAGIHETEMAEWTQRLDDPLHLVRRLCCGEHHVDMRDARGDQCSTMSRR